MKLTTAQAFVFHMLLSVLMGALFAGVTALVQAIGSNGLIDVRVAVSAGVAAFLAWFGKGLVSLESNPQTAQAALDTLKELQASHNTLLSQVSNLAGVMTSLLHITSVSQSSQFAQPLQTAQLIPSPVATSIPPGQSTLPTQFVTIPPSAQQSLDRGWSAMLPAVQPPQQG